MAAQTRVAASAPRSFEAAVHISARTSHSPWRGREAATPRHAANFRSPATHVSLTLISAIASGLTL
jgi:hypothetical protein